MRSHFEPPTPPLPDPAEFIKTAIIVLDTNALLEPYRYSVPTRNSALDALEKVGDRLWMPHQVGVEFFRNYEPCRDELSQAYDKALSILDEALKEVRASFGNGKNFQKSREAVRTKADGSIQRLKAGLRKLRNDDPAVISGSDHVLERLTEIFKGRLGVEPDPAAIRRRVDDFHNWRVPNMIPPGFEDVPRKGRTIRAAGDYLIWEEILTHAEESRTDVLLVTNDSKGDWWEKNGGSRNLPHRALRKEFAERTGHTYHQMNLLEFIKEVDKAYEVEIEDSAVDEIEEIEEEARRSDAFESLQKVANPPYDSKYLRTRDFEAVLAMNSEIEAIRKTSQWYGSEELRKQLDLGETMRDVLGMKDQIETIRKASQWYDSEALRKQLDLGETIRRATGSLYGHRGARDPGDEEDPGEPHQGADVSE